MLVAQAVGYSFAPRRGISTLFFGGRPSTMTAPAEDKTAESVAELRAAVASEIDAADASFPVDDACLRRYLRARDGNVKKATKMRAPEKQHPRRASRKSRCRRLLATLKWRKEYGTATIVEDKFPVLEVECATGKTSGPARQ